MSRLIRLSAVGFWLVSVTAVLTPALAADRAGMAASALVDSDRVLVIAHRGDSRVAPENTLAAFESAVQAGADLVELDYYHSADNVPVVLHDATLDRTTDARERFMRKGAMVTKLKLDDLRELDAGRWFDEKFAGQRIPTLDEAVRVIQSGSMTLIERKGGDARTCVEYLRKNGLLDRVVVQSFDWDYVRDGHKLAPEMTQAALGGAEITDTTLDRIEATGARIVAWRHSDLTAEAIAKIHARGLRAWCFTVNDLDRVKELVDADIDAIITDTPAAVKRCLVVPASR